MLRCRIDEAIEKLENGSEVQDTIDAIAVLALEMNDLKESYNVQPQVLTRS